MAIVNAELVASLHHINIAVSRALINLRDQKESQEGDSNK
jgi:tRNA threonylcarbamoyladenosine modification (KEOPS) complex Cgi121 subunit